MFSEKYPTIPPKVSKSVSFQVLIYIYRVCLNMSNLDRNVYVRIQGSKIPIFAQKLLEIE